MKQESLLNSLGQPKSHVKVQKYASLKENTALKKKKKTKKGNSKN